MVFSRSLLILAIATVPNCARHGAVTPAFAQKERESQRLRGGDDVRRKLVSTGDPYRLFEPRVGAVDIQSETPSALPTDYQTNGPTSMPSSFAPTSSPSSSIPTSSPSSPPLTIPSTAYLGNSQELTQQSFITGCTPQQVHLRIDVKTDNYPLEVSWRFIDRSSNAVMLSSPQDGYSGKGLGKGMMEAQTDTRDLCVDTADSISSSSRTRTTALSNRYEFVLTDQGGDGLCCRSGVQPGYYKLMQKKPLSHGAKSTNEEDEWQVIVAGSEFNSKEVRHHFEIRNHHGLVGSTGIEQPIVDDKEGTNRAFSPTSPSLSLICPTTQRKITIQIQTDETFGADTSWDLRLKDGPIIAKNEQTFVNNRVQLEERDVCVDDSSLYEFTVYDEYGDGMDTRYGKGHYKIFTHHSVDVEADASEGEAILHGGYFIAKNITHLINTTIPAMTERDVKWLTSHNKRRRYWHEHYNTTFIPLQWSESLKAEAQVWANALLDSCYTGAYHDPSRIYGENAAHNDGYNDWATRREPEKILTRFVEYELDWSWPANGHLTQTLWRASKYVGCAESHKASDDDGWECHMQVCRYARTGNCNMGSFKLPNGTIDWLTPTLEDVNYCGPICPTGGCHA